MGLILPDSYIGLDAHSSLELAKFTRGSVVDVKADFNVPANGVDDDYPGLQAAADACFGTRLRPLRPIWADSPYNYRKLYLPAGHYKVSQPIKFEWVNGGMIFGAGRFATKIESTQIDGSVFVTEGFQYSRVSDMTLQSNGLGICFDFNKTLSGGPSLQSIHCENMNFVGGAHGTPIGRGNLQGSELTFMNCFWAQNTLYALSVWNYNALQVAIYGGNMQACGTGIKVLAGSVPIISGVGFQQSTNWDIDVSTSGAGDTCNVHGCRTESPHFIKHAFSQVLIVIGCMQRGPSAADGDFVQSTGPVTIDGCVSQAGAVSMNTGEVRNSQFGRTDWITATQHARISNVLYGGTASAGKADSARWGGFIETATVRGMNIIPDYIPPISVSYYDFIADKGYSNGSAKLSTYDFTWVRASANDADIGTTKINIFNANEPRLNSAGLFIEVAGTNLQIYSQDATNWGLPGATSVPDSNTPVGYNNGTVLIISPTSANVAHGIYGGNPTAFVGGSTYTASVLVYDGATGGQGEFLQFVVDDGAGNGFWQEFNVHTRDVSFGAVAGHSGVTGTGVLTSVSSVHATDGGWTRITMTGVIAAASGNANMGVFMTPPGGSATLKPAFVGNVLDSFNWYGAQLELGTKMTSYKGTTTAAATHDADAATLTIPAGFTSLTYTFDDNSTQTVVVSAGAYTIPTNLNRQIIKIMKIT